MTPAQPCKFRRSISPLSTRGDSVETIFQSGLLNVTGCRNVYERCDPLLRKGEGLPVMSRVLAGDEPPQRLMVRDASRLVPMDIRTGFTYPR